MRPHRSRLCEDRQMDCRITACDQTGDTFDLPLAVDRVRLFSRTNSAYADKARGLIGNNGSVVEVVSIDKTGITLRNASGRVGRVAWERHPDSGRIRLSYGDALTIDASQGLTSTEQNILKPCRLAHPA